MSLPCLPPPIPDSDPLRKTVMFYTWAQWWGSETGDVGSSSSFSWDTSRFQIQSVWPRSTSSFHFWGTYDCNLFLFAFALILLFSSFYTISNFFLFWYTLPGKLCYIVWKLHSNWINWLLSKNSSILDLSGIFPLNDNSFHFIPHSVYSFNKAFHSQMQKDRQTFSRAFL